MQALLFFAVLLFSSLNGEEQLHKLTVNGSAIVSKPADKLSVSIGVVTQGPNVQEVVQANAQKMQKVLAALKKAGLSDSEIKTGGFSIALQYSQPPRNPPADWRPDITGYQVRNTLLVQTQKLELAGPLLDAASKEGANLIDNLAFTLQDMQSAEAEAISQAVQQARLYADSAAKAAGVALGPVLELNINPLMATPRMMKGFSMAMAEPSTPVLPGDVEVTASVGLVYEIKH